MTEYPPEIRSQICEYLEAVGQGRKLDHSDPAYRIGKICEDEKLIEVIPEITNLKYTGDYLEFRTGKGELFLLTHAKSQKSNKHHEWSEAKSPADWRKLLGGMSDSTMRRHIKNGNLIVDKISTKLWRIKQDSLQRYRGSK